MKHIKTDAASARHHVSRLARHLARWATRAVRKQGSFQLER